MSGLERWRDKKYQRKSKMGFQRLNLLEAAYFFTSMVDFETGHANQFFSGCYVRPKAEESSFSETA